MKIFKLILFNTKKLFFESKKMSFFIIIGITFAAFGVLFYSGYFMNTFYNTTFINELEITSFKKIDINTLSSLFDKIADEKGFVRMIAYNNEDYEDAVDIIGMYEKNFEDNILCGKAYSLHDNTPCGIISEYSMDILGYNKNITGEIIERNGIEFKICGIHSSILGFCVPMEYYINHYPLNKIHVEFDHNISNSLLDTLKADNYEYKIIENVSPFESMEFMTNLIIAISIFCISFINILMIFSLWEEKMKPSFRIYYIYGCSKIQNFFIVSGEFYIVSVFGTLLGESLFLSLYRQLGKMTLIYIDNYKNYLYITLFILFILLIFSVCFGYKNMIRQQILFRTKE